MATTDFRLKIIELMQELKIHAPESMVDRLSDSGIKKIVTGNLEKPDGYLLVDKSVFQNLPLLTFDESNDNKIVLLRNSNDLEFIFNLYQIYKGGFLPILISPLTTDSEIADFIKRFSPCGVLDGGIFKKTGESNLFPKLNESDAAVILTSGSSGKPKAVVHTFLSLFNAATRANCSMGVDGQDRWLLSLPLHHISGFSILYRSIVGSIPLILAESLNPADKEFGNALRIAPTLVSFVPSQLRDFITSWKIEATNFRHILVGGSAVDPSLIKSSIDADFKLSKVYGSSETAAFIAVTGYNSLKEDINSASRPLDGVTVSVEDGELIVETDQLFNRYLDDDALTSDKLVDGKFHTGDVVEIDSKGLFKITGRKNRFIISGGLNVDPQEVERIILTFPGIIEVFVFSVVNEKWGEAVSALLKTDGEIDFQDFHSYLKSHLMVYKIPKYYRIVDEIPLTAIGKHDLEGSRQLLFER